METATFPKIELIQVADVVAREKGIERDEVLEAMEQAIQKAGRSKYGQEHDIRATIDRQTGEIRLVRCTEVVAARMAKILGWDQARKASMIAAYQADVARSRDWRIV